MLFSVIVATYNRPEKLAECLASLEKLEFEGDYEVLVVNDGSSACYSEVEERFPEVRWLRQPNRGPGAARNHGAQLAKGEYLAFTDDDCRVDANWLTQLEAVLRQYPDCVVGGTTRAANQGNPYDLTSQLIQHMVYDYFNRDPHHATFFASNNLAISCQLFLKVGGFRPEFDRIASEDRDLCDRLLHLGQRLVWARSALVWHAPDLDLRRYCSTFFRYGRGAALYHSHRKVGSLRQDSRFYLVLPGLFWSRLRSCPELRRVRFFLLLLLWQVCNTLGYLHQLSKTT